MNTSRVIRSAKEIERCRSALNWLEEYGSRMSDDNEGCASISVRLNYARSCPGANEAQEMLSLYATGEIAKTVKSAMENCRNTIEMCEQAIREEARA